MKASAIWREISDLPLQACMAGLGELWVAGWEGVVPTQRSPNLVPGLAQITANAHRGLVFKCLLFVSLWDILLMISDVCLPVN